MASPLQDLDAARLRFNIEGAGAPVVLLHGFGLDPWMWDDQLAALADRHLVIRYDMHGHARSSLPTTDPSAHADDLQALLGILDAGPAHVVGRSNGGRIALRVSLRHPDAIRPLALVDTALDGHACSPQGMALWNLMVNAARGGGLGGAKRLCLDHPLFAPRTGASQCRSGAASGRWTLFRQALGEFRSGSRSRCACDSLSRHYPDSHIGHRRRARPAGLP